jgi:TolB protein
MITEYSGAFRKTVLTILIALFCAVIAFNISRRAQPSTREAATFGTTNPPTQNRVIDERAADISKIAFTRDDFIYLHDLKKNQTKKLTEGYDPDISPDGKRIAYTINRSSAADGETMLKLYEMQTRAVTDFQPLIGWNVRRARWSPDGSKLAFQMVVDHVARVGILDTRTGVWIDVTKGLVVDDPSGVNLDSWAPDANSLLCHDHFKIYEISLEGTVKAAISFRGLIPFTEIFSGNRFQLSTDRKWILFNGLKSENTGIYLLKLSDNTVREITPATEHAADARWFGSSSQIMFSRGRPDPNEGIYDLCKLSIESGDVSIIVKDAAEGSYSIE